MMTTILFSKMHGLGNDFMVINGIKQPLQLSTQQIQQWASRHTGIGFDQLLLLEPSTRHDCDFFYRIYNADGSEVAQCGNGARCISLFIHLKQLSGQKKLCLQTKNGTLQAQLMDDQQVRVNMGVPKFSPNDIPFSATTLAETYPLIVNNQTFIISALSLGNPHAVLFVDDVAQAPIATLGAAIEKHVDFPQNVNVGFVQIIDRQHIKLRVFERGVGETHACGSGACAAAVAAQQRGLIEKHVKVHLTGGQLTIDWRGTHHSVWMTGDACHVFDGTIKVQHNE